MKKNISFVLRIYSRIHHGSTLTQLFKSYIQKYTVRHSYHYKQFLRENGLMQFLILFNHVGHLNQNQSNVPNSMSENWGWILTSTEAISCSLPEETKLPNTDLWLVWGCWSLHSRWARLWPLICSQINLYRLNGLLRPEVII